MRNFIFLEKAEHVLIETFLVRVELRLRGRSHGQSYFLE